VSTPLASSSKQSISSVSSQRLVSSRAEEAGGSASGVRDRTSRRDRAPPAAAVSEDNSSSEAVDSNTSDTTAAAAASAAASGGGAVSHATDVDAGSEVGLFASSLQECLGTGTSEVLECLKEELVEDDGSPALVAWQARDAALLARRSHPCPLPQALFAPDILLSPQQAAALAGGAAPPKRQPSKPFLAFMDGLSALQCVSLSGVVALDIERIFPLGPCNDSLR
jgi:hypothetical protein